MTFAAEILQAIDDLSTDEDLTADDILQDIRDKAAAGVSLDGTLTGVRSAIRILDRAGAGSAADAVWDMYDGYMISVGRDSVTVTEDALPSAIRSEVVKDVLSKWGQLSSRPSTAHSADMNEFVEWLKTLA